MKVKIKSNNSVRSYMEKRGFPKNLRKVELKESINQLVNQTCIKKR